MTQPSFRRQWLVVWILVLAAAGWVLVGRSWFRRHVLKPVPIADAERLEDKFLALMFPRITPSARKYAMSRPELADLLGGLQEKGYVSISLEDVREFYAGRRLLPSKAVLLVFSGDDPRGVMLADRVLKKLRLRGNVFIARESFVGDSGLRLGFISHEIEQMRAGGAWQFGWSAREGAELGFGRLRFASSELGLNDMEDDPQDLHIMAVHAGRLREMNERIIENSWPRRTEIVGDFTTRELDPDWIAGWGVISKTEGRLALLPLPRQTGAGLFLRGTEKWRDSVIEFDLDRHQKEFWVYARYRGESGYLRVGIHDGWWHLEQKISLKNPPTILARARAVEDGRPARVRIVLKDETVIVHVNGRMQFGRSRRVNSRIARGRILFGVNDSGSRSALAVLSRVRTEPVKEEWIAFEDGTERVGFDENRLEAVREGAVHARAISPRWLAIDKNGNVMLVREQETLIRSLAGFYGCRLVPMAEFPAEGVSGLADPAAAARLLGGLDAAARELDASGLNLRVRGSDLERPEMLRFLATLGSRFRAAHRQVWITAVGPVRSEAAALLRIDGVLRPSTEARDGYQLLAAIPTLPANVFPKEFASIP